MTITGQPGVVVSDDAVITGFSDGRLVAYAKKDGATLWDQDLSGGEQDFVDVSTTPVIADGLLVAASYRHGLLGLNLASGEVVWSHPGEGFGTPAAFEGILYVPQARGGYLAIEAQTGRVIWYLALGDAKSPDTPAISRRYIFGPVGSCLVVLDRTSGRELYRVDDMWGFSSTPEVAWGRVYAQSNSGHVYAFNLY